MARSSTPAPLSPKQASELYFRTIRSTNPDTSLLRAIEHAERRSQTGSSSTGSKPANGR